MEFLTPAEAHFQKAMALHRGETDNGLSRAQLNHYDEMLHRLRTDKTQLSEIQGNSRKAEYKKNVIPNYQGWIDGVLEAQNGLADEVFVTLIIWHLDAGLYAKALDMAAYALAFNLPLPDDYNRTLATTLIDEICDRSLQVRASGKQDETVATLDELLRLAQLTANQDMPDGARAKLYKVIGFALKDDEKRQVDALEYLQQAILLDKDVGVKKDIEQLLRATAKKDDSPSNDDIEAPKPKSTSKTTPKKATTAAKPKTTTRSTKAAKS